MKRQGRVILICIVATAILMNGNTAYASENNVSISPETNEMLKEVVEDCDVEDDYFSHIIDSYVEYGYADTEELNNILVETAESIQKGHNKSQIELENAYNKYADVANLQKDSTTYNILAYNAAVGTFQAGANLIRGRGCSHTAESMEHAIVPYEKIGTSWAPSTLRYSDDSWAQALFTRTGLWSEIERRFQGEVLPSMPPSKIIDGTYAFDSNNSSLDAYLQLHNVNYSVTFMKNPDDPYSYRASMYISDIYDFEWSKYDNVIVDFANNYAKALQDMGAIEPYQIVCSFHM